MQYTFRLANNQKTQRYGSPQYQGARQYQNQVKQWQLPYTHVIATIPNKQGAK